MSPFDGWPPPPDLPPDPSSNTTLVVGVVAFAFVCVVVVLLLGKFADQLDERFTRQEDERRQRMRQLERACAEERRDLMLELLIDQSPGGRKPWQERKK